MEQGDMKSSKTHKRITEQSLLFHPITFLPIFNDNFYSARLGLPAPFQTPDEQTGLFKKMDENGDGSISYDEWLGCFLSEIIAPVAAL